MNTIIKIFIYLKWMTISKKQVIQWQQTKNETMLIFTLKKGWYKERKLAAKILGQIRSQKAIPQLIKSCQDENKMVGKAAIHALELLPKTVAIQHALKEAQEYWTTKTEQEQGRKDFFKKLKKSDINVVNRVEKMAQLERVRQQLKSSIRMH